MCRAGKTHKHKNIITVHVLTKTATQETINCSIPEEIQVKKKETRQTLFIDWIFSLCKVLGRNIAEHNSSVLVLFKSHQKLFTWMMIRHQKPSSSLRTADYHILFEQILLINFSIYDCICGAGHTQKRFFNIPTKVHQIDATDNT